MSRTAGLHRLIHLVSSAMDPFLNDGYDLPYNANARFSRPGHTFLNNAQASEVSVNTLCSLVSSSSACMRIHLT
jgi:hypothetical protein